MKQSWNWTLIFCVALGLGWTGCKKTAKAPAKTRKASSRPTPRAAKAPAKASGSWFIDGYEKVRKALAADDLKAAKAAASAFGKAATTHAKGADKAGFTALAAAATKLNEAKDIAAARLAFGELSKHAITYLSAHKELQKDLTTYRCPMAKGYKKWVQYKSEMANPYMGKKMLKCGSKVTLAP